MAVQKLKSVLHTKLISACYHFLFHSSEKLPAKNLNNEELVNLIIDSSYLENCNLPKVSHAIEEFLKLSKIDQKEYLLTYIFTDKEY
jgi:hypothetical protein